MNKKPVYSIRLGKRYKKDIKRLQKSNRDLRPLEEAIDTLAKGERLPITCRDHPLKGSLKGMRACHIDPDWLLRYLKKEDVLILLLLRSGTHRDVLGIE